MPNKKVARIDIVKAVAGVSFATLAAIGGSTGNPLIAALTTIPAAGLASYEAVGDQLAIFKGQKEKPLEISAPPWWQHDSRAWQNLCSEIGSHLPQILEETRAGMQQEQQVITADVVRQIFSDALANQQLTCVQDNAQKRHIGEYIAAPILQKLEGLTAEIERRQREGALQDNRNTAQNTEQTVRVLEQIHAELSGTLPDLNEEELAALHKGYCNALHKRWKMLDFRGIMHVDPHRSISIPLTEVFVFPSLRAGVPEHEIRERADEPSQYDSQQKALTRFTPPLRSELETQRRLVLLGPRHRPPGAEGGPAVLPLQVAKSRSEAFALGIAVAGWIVPGLGHALLKMWGRALACFLTVGLLVFFGAGMRGNVFTSSGNDAFDTLGYLADLGAGSFYFVARSLETNGPDVSRADGDYGTRFLAAAGVLNVLAALHAYEAARGRKA